ncbi:MAG: DUF362 domain-containing protein [Candidatus Thermoplasmatota archaeon]
MRIICRRRLLEKLLSLRGVLFHIVGISCLIWFLIRVGTAPHRAYYPCQRVSMPVAMAYIAFWVALFASLSKWVHSVRRKVSKAVPLILTCILSCTLIGAVLAGSYLNKSEVTDIWIPSPKEPIGTPQGLNPGRVVWVWDPDATLSNISLFWWMNENNNQSVIDAMMTKGITTLAGVDDIKEAWDRLFVYYNEIHGYGSYPYQNGEKIAIKINLNNCWVYRGSGYLRVDNERDASPQVVKSLLRQLVNIVGVKQEDITVFDASRPMANWFYYRVYYKDYPSYPLEPEFPYVHYVDSTGGAPGREKANPSGERIYFADGTGLYRTLPTCVTEAKYIINVPLLKRHPIKQGVTLAGKNLYGVFIEPVVDLHPYHESSFIMGNPAPQVDLLSHNSVGGKTLLYIGDGLYGTKVDHKTIDKFQMYPFNDDWTNSLFFSQDPVAIDSVMFDILKEEGTNPVEGSHNYLHQAAEPPLNTYDPEGDGLFLDHSLGVHEHADTSLDIFSPSRYSGSAMNGIEYIPLGWEKAHKGVVIVHPREYNLYVNNRNITRLPFTFIVGDINIEARVNGVHQDIDRVEFYLNGKIQYVDYTPPYIWVWDKPSLLRRCIVKVTAYYDNDDISSSMIFWKLL